MVTKIKKIRLQIIDIMKEHNNSMYLNAMLESINGSKPKIRGAMGRMINRKELFHDDTTKIYSIDPELLKDSEPEVSEENIQPQDTNSEPSDTSLLPPQEEEKTDNVEEKKPEIEIPMPPELITDPEIQHKGLNAKMMDIEQKLDIALGVKEKKEKKSRLKKFTLGKLKRFNKGKYRGVIIMSANQNARLVKGEYIMGMIHVGDNYYDGSALYTWLWEGKQPVYFIPEWSIRPIAAEEVLRRAIEDKTLIDSQIITIRAMAKIKQENEDAGGQKKPANIMMFVGIAVLIGIVAYIFIGGKKGG